jgi:hypothetical protein
LNRSPTIIGEEEVVRAAVEHSASVHGHEDTPELRQQVRRFLEPPEAHSNEGRAKEPMPLTGAAMARRVAVCRGAPRRVELTAATYGRPSLWAASQVRSPCGLSLVNSVVEM